MKFDNKTVYQTIISDIYKFNNQLKELNIKMFFLMFTATKIFILFIPSNTVLYQVVSLLVLGSIHDNNTVLYILITV